MSAHCTAIADTMGSRDVAIFANPVRFEIPKVLSRTRNFRVHRAKAPPVTLAAGIESSRPAVLIVSELVLFCIPMGGEKRGEEKDTNVRAVKANEMLQDSSVADWFTCAQNEIWMKSPAYTGLCGR